MKTSLPSLFVLSAGLFLLPLNAELRTFTNTEGQTLSAELIKADETSATLRIKGGRIATVKLDTLSETDQVFVQKWLTDKVPDIEVSPDFDRGNSKNRIPGSNSNRGGNTQTFGFKVKLKNFSPDNSLEPTDVTYYLVGKSVADDSFKIISRQSQEISLDPGETKLIRFVEIKNIYTTPFKTIGDVPSGRFGYKVLGYILEIQRKRDMRLIYLESPTTFLDNAKSEIIALAEGDVTKSDFILPPEKPKEMVVEEVPKPEVITIK